MKFRVDVPHQSSADRPAAELGPVRQWLQIRSLAHLVYLGLLVFLLGQALLIWSFLVGHYAAWSIANLVSLAGIATAFVAVALTLRNFDRRLQDFARLLRHDRRSENRAVGVTRSAKSSLRD